MKTPIRFFFILFQFLQTEMLLAQQQPVIEWDATYGGSSSDTLTCVQQTSDGGYILGGFTNSPVSGDVTQPSRGKNDFWIVKTDSHGVKQWDARYGGSENDYLHSIKRTNDGGYILGGYSNSPISGDKTQGSQGSYDFWIVKVDANGIKQWDARYGGNCEDTLYAIQHTTDGGYILGGYSCSGVSGDKTQPTQGGDDYWIVKVDSNGVKQWDARFGGLRDDRLAALQQTTDGGYILGGLTHSPHSGDVTAPEFGSKDFWIVKTDSHGVKQWDKRYGGSDRDILNAMQQTSDGGYILGGPSASNISGTKTQNSQGQEDYWIVKTGANGIKQWDFRYGGTNVDIQSALHQTFDKGYILGGYSFSGIGGNKTQDDRGLADFWIVKTDSNAVKKWDLRFGGSNIDVLTDLKQTSDSGYILAGFSNSGADGDKTQANKGGNDFWIVKLSAEPSTWYADADGDGYGNPSSDSISIYKPIGYVKDRTDCNDGDAAIHPNAVETCNGLDDNCNNLVDDGLTFTTYYADADGDGYGSSASLISCSPIPPPGYSANNSDCNDSDAAIHPNAVEICNGLDDNCNNLIDDGLTFTTYFVDGDGDGYGSSASLISCSPIPPPGYSANNLDCNDSDSTVHPNATEICNGLDDDCNNLIDDGLTFTTYYVDADGDGYGSSASTLSCSPVPPPGYSANNLDCNDSDAAIHPGAAEICNGIDDNCNSQIDENSITVSITPSGTFNSCKMTPVTFTATGDNINSYQWYKDTHPVQGQTNSVYTSSIGTNFYVSVSNTLGCNAVSATTTVIRNPLPGATITVVNGNLDLCLGTVTLRGPGGTTIAWQWLKNNVPITGATNRKYLPSSTGDYKVTVTKSSTGCSATSSAVTVFTSCRENGVAEIQFPITIYPNPNDGQFVISIKLNGISDENVVIQIVNVLGEVVQEEKSFIANQELFQPMQVKDVANGIYMVRVVGNEQVYTGSFVYER